MSSSQLLQEELKRSFQFFWNHANHQPNSPGYGLMLDRSNNAEVASIAAVGFALTAYVIGVEYGLITYEEALTRVKGTLQTLQSRVPHYDGFWVHFCGMKDAAKIGNCEYSTIDTALALNGVIVCDSYFQDAGVHEIAAELLTRVQYQNLWYQEEGRKLFHMAYHGDSAEYAGSWDMCAEQLMMYLQAAGQDAISSELAKELYLGFDRPVGSYGGHTCHYEPGGTLFVYQYSHCWFDFSRYQGCDGINWHENSRQATLAHIAWCKDHPQYRSFAEGLWGVSAFDGPDGYIVHGLVPGSVPVRTDGTVGPCAIAGALPFTYEESLKALTYLYEHHPKIWGEYGFQDSYNGDRNWIAPTYLGIDKGETLLMIDSVRKGCVYQYYMAHPHIQKAIEKLGMQKI